MDISVTPSAILGLPVVVAGSAVAQDFLKRIFGPIADETGKALSHPLREWNEKRVRLGLETIEAAAEMLDAAGRKATPVPGRVLLPLLNAAAVEEDPDLRRMWATLLSNAADSDRRADMLPSFVSILKELSPVEALVLEAVYDDENKTDPYEHRISYLPEDHPTARFNPDKMRLFAGKTKDGHREVELPYGNFRVMADNLARLGLIEPVFSNVGYGQPEINKVYAPLVLSALGQQFIGACVLPPATMPPTNTKPRTID